MPSGAVSPREFSSTVRFRNCTRARRTGSLNASSCCLRQYSRPECLRHVHDSIGSRRWIANGELMLVGKAILAGASTRPTRVAHHPRQDRPTWPASRAALKRAQRASRRCRVDYGCPNREKGPLFMSGVRRQSNPKPPAQAAGALLGTSRSGTTPLPCPTTPRLRLCPPRPCASSSESSRSPWVSPVLVLTHVPFAISCR